MGDDGDDDYDDGFGDEHTQESEDEYGFEEDDPSRKNSRASNTAAAAAAAVKRDDDLRGRGSRGSSQDFEPDDEDAQNGPEEDAFDDRNEASNAAAAAAATRDDNLGGRGSRGSSQDFEPDDEDAQNGPEEDAFEERTEETQHGPSEAGLKQHSFHTDDDGSRASSREFQEPDLPWAEDPPPNVQFGSEETQHGPSEAGLKQHSFHIDDDGSRASSREFQEPDLPWAEDPPPNVQFGSEETQHGPSEAGLKQHSFHVDDDGSRASSREFQEPDLPWAEDPPPNVQFGSEEVEWDPPGADLNQPDEDEEAEFGRPQMQEVHHKDPETNSRAAKDKLAAEEPTDDLQRAEVLYRRMLAWRGADGFQAGNEVDQTIFKKSSSYRSVESSTWLSHSAKLGDSHMGMEEDAWRAAMDKLAAAHESAGDVERAESLYLRMLAWREGADQFQAGNYEVGQTLFKKSSTYRSVEDATWFLHNVKPDDGHMGMEAVALLALGEEIAAKAAIAVWTLALRASQREQLTKAGALELTAKAIAFHSNNPELQAAGAGVLRLLCSGHRLAQRNRRRVIFLGGAESILNAIQTFPDDCEVMREACGALRAMAHKNPVGARRIIENDGFKYCMEALEYPDDSVSSLASKAIGALQCAAEVDFRGTDAQAENLQAVWEARLREEREAGMRACCEKLRGPLTTGVLEAILATICIFMEDPVRYKFLNIVQPVVVCMQMFPGNPRIQVPSCQILLSLTSNGSLGNEHEEAIQKFAKCCGISPLVQAMKDLPCNLHLQRLAMGVLGNFLSGGDMNKTAAARATAIPTLITAMQRFKKEADLQEEAINCLTKLCDTLGRASVAARLGLIDAVIAAIKSKNYGEIEGKLTELSCIILCMFSDDQKLRQEMVKAGALNVAKQVISKARSLDIQRWGCELLRSLSQPY